MRTPKLHWTAHLWPGLPHLWNRGSWAGLALAVGFAVLVNALLATLVYREWMVGNVRWIAIGGLLTVWLLAWLESRADWRKYVAEWKADGDPDGVAMTDRLFREAQRSYLEGDWVTTERRLLELLKKDSHDVEGRLMLATLWRHLNRPAEAKEQLDRLEQLEAAAAWHHEITKLREALISTDYQDESISENHTDTNNPSTNTEDPNRRLAA